MAVFKIGQIQTVTEDVETESEITGNKIFIKKGSKRIIGADGFAHYRDGMIQRIGDDVKVEGYDIHGLSSYILSYLMRFFPDDMLEEYEISEDNIQEQIEWALEEII